MSLLLAIIATYRLATDLTQTDGPARLFARLRAWAIRVGGDHVADGVGCPVCASFWLAIPLAAVALAVEPLPWLLWLPAWLAVAGGARWLWMQERP